MLPRYEFKPQCAINGEKSAGEDLLGDMLHCSISPIEFVRILFSLLLGDMLLEHITS